VIKQMLLSCKLVQYKTYQEGSTLAHGETVQGKMVKFLMRLTN
jgi:hypothetical protein